MSHIARIGRQSAKTRTGIAALYAVLLLGTLTTVYPFLLMVSTGAKSQTDYAEYSPSALVPRFLHDDHALYAKYLEDRYANNLDDLNAAHNADYVNVASVPVPAPDARTAALADDWNTFGQTLPLTLKKAGFGEHDAAPSRLLLLYREHLRKTFNNDINALNKTWTEENVSFEGVTPPFERTALRDWMPDTTSPKVQDWTQFRQTLPANFLIVTTADPLFRAYLKQDVYEDKLPNLNAAWHSHYTDWAQITLAPRLIGGESAAQKADWETFVRTKLPLRMLGVNAQTALPAWRGFLARQKRQHAETAALPTTPPRTGDVRTDWNTFIARVVPLDALTANTPENLWRTHLAATRPPAIGSVPDNVSPPQALSDFRFAQTNAASLRPEFATRNFRAVAGYILLHGRAVGNTALFCALAILAAVVVNPLCAYALSRYPLPYVYQVLMFLLATMAFPAEVAMIPNFLLLRDLHLLNTFYALVLPGLASGFSIFLLKGFFDSLPRELYEAGILDGATEITMFRRITVPLSLPIFSVIALNAFTASYGAFLFALVTCQDQKMWTLMVWLYDLQATAPQYEIMAALTLAALPTLIVFMFAQKIIMRGIILPSFK